MRQADYGAQGWKGGLVRHLLLVGSALALGVGAATDSGVLAVVGGIVLGVVLSSVAADLSWARQSRLSAFAEAHRQHVSAVDALASQAPTMRGPRTRPEQAPESQQWESTTYYSRERGPIEVETMAPVHAARALGKLERVHGSWVVGSPLGQALAAKADEANGESA